MQWWLRLQESANWAVTLILPTGRRFFPDFAVGVEGRNTPDRIALVEIKDDGASGRLHSDDNRVKIRQSHREYGNVVWTVREAAARVVAAARGGGGPQFVEAITYRYVGHSRSDPGKYRPPGELDRWRERDPLLLVRARLEADGVEAAALDELEASVEAQLAEMEQRGLAAPFPEPLELPEFA